MSTNPIKLLHLLYIIVLLCPCLDCTLFKKSPGPLPVNMARRPGLAPASSASGSVNYKRSTPKAWLEALIPRALLSVLSPSEAVATDVSLTTRSPTLTTLAAAPTTADAALSRTEVMSVSLETAITPVTPATPEAPTRPATSDLPVITSGPLPSCMWAQCSLYYQYVRVYHWPQKSPNTACLSTLSSPPDLAPPHGLDLQSPSVLVIFDLVTASNGCNRIGSTYANITTSFTPRDLSTIRPDDNSTRSYNFADLPCPPRGVKWNSTGPYAPLLSPPPFLFKLDPAFANCIPACHQGVDGPIVLHSVPGRISQPIQRPAGPPHPHKKAIEPAHVVPRAPRKTTDSL